MGKEGAPAMKTELKTVRVIPYGRLSNRISGFAHGQVARRLRVTKKWERFLQANELGYLLLAFPDDVDDGFAEAFRERAAPHTKLLLLDDSRFSDRILSRLIDLQIRSCHRVYIVDSHSLLRDESKWEELLRSFLGRLSASLESNNDRIFDAHIEDGILRVVSPDFQRLEVPISKIEELAKADKRTLEHFEIVDDGSYIYCPDLDLHLGWHKLLHVVNPDAVSKSIHKYSAYTVSSDNVD